MGAPLAQEFIQTEIKKFHKTSAHRIVALGALNAIFLQSATQS